jgi:hypothetical protein
MYAIAERQKRKRNEGNISSNRKQQRTDIKMKYVNRQSVFEYWCRVGCLDKVKKLLSCLI